MDTLRKMEAFDGSCFVEAAEFADGTARVQEISGKSYYINEEGKRITKDYQDGSLTFEMQGLYCRVQEEDGTWEIINRDDKVVFLVQK